MNSTPSPRLPSRFGRTVLARGRVGRQRLVNLWIDHPTTELPAVVLGGVVAAFWAPHWFSVNPASWATWLQTLAGSVAAVLGLSTLSVTILYTFTDRPRLNELRETLGVRLQDQLLNCLRAFLISLGGLSLLFGVDRSEHRRLFDAVLGVLITLVVLRTARLAWLFRRVIQALAIDHPEKAPPPVREAWKAPVVSDTDYARRRRKPKVRRTQ